MSNHPKSYVTCVFEPCHLVFRLLPENNDTQGEADHGILNEKFYFRTLVIIENSVGDVTDSSRFCCPLPMLRFQGMSSQGRSPETGYTLGYYKNGLGFIGGLLVPLHCSLLCCLLSFHWYCSVA